MSTAAINFTGCTKPSIPNLNSLSNTVMNTSNRDSGAKSGSAKKGQREVASVIDYDLALAAGVPDGSEGSYNAVSRGIRCEENGLALADVFVRELSCTWRYMYGYALNDTTPAWNASRNYGLATDFLRIV